MNLSAESSVCFFFFNDTATTEIYTLSLHDALPIFNLWRKQSQRRGKFASHESDRESRRQRLQLRLSRSDSWDANRSEEHTSELQSQSISYAVFCLKKKDSDRTYKSSPLAHARKTSD